MFFLSLFVYIALYTGCKGIKIYLGGVNLTPLLLTLVVGMVDIIWFVLVYPKGKSQKCYMCLWIIGYSLSVLMAGFIGANLVIPFFPKTIYGEDKAMDINLIINLSIIDIFGPILFQLVAMCGYVYNIYNSEGRITKKNCKMSISRFISFGLLRAFLFHWVSLHSLEFVTMSVFQVWQWWDIVVCTAVLLIQFFTFYVYLYVPIQQNIERLERMQRLHLGLPPEQDEDEQL